MTRSGLEFSGTSTFLAIEFVADRAEAVVAGEIDISNVDDVRDLLLVLGRYGARRLVLDLDGVSFIDLTGLEALLDLEEVFASQGGGLTLRNPSRSVAMVLDVTGADGVFEVERSLPDPRSASWWPAEPGSEG